MIDRLLRLHRAFPISLRWDMASGQRMKRLMLPAFSPVTVTTRVIAIAVILAVPLNLIVFTVIWHLSEASNEVQRTSLLYAARSVAAAVDAKLGKYMAIAEALARSPALLDDNLDPFEAEARRAFATSPEALVVVANINGQQLLNTAQRPGQRLPFRDAAGVTIQKRAFQTGAAIVSDAHVGALSGVWIVHIEVPIFKNGEPFRTLAVAVKAQSFFHLLNAQQLPKDWLTGIMDGTGRYIARVPGDDTYIGRYASDSWRKVGDQIGVFEMVSREGDPIVAANIPSALCGWVVGLAIKKTEMRAAAWHASRWAVLLGGGFSALSLFFAVVIARSITQPIEELRKRAAALMSRSTPSMLSRGPPEVWELSKALRQSAADRDKIEQALRESEAKLRLALDAAELGIWRWDQGDKELQWDSRCRTLFGVAPGASVTYDDWANSIVPEDRAKTEANVARALDPDDPNDETFCEFRIRHTDGTVLWLSSTGRAFFEPEPAVGLGRRLAFKAGTVRDITQIRSAEAALRDSEERFRSVFERAATGIVIRDMQERFLRCNPAFSAIIGYSERELLELAFPTYVHADDKEENVAQCRRLLAGEFPSFEIVNRYVRKDGRAIWVHKYVSLLRDAAGKATNILILVTDVTGQKRQENQIQLLMREVNHRSKNLLALVQSIARQTLAANSEDFIERFGQRVEALAASQDLLIKNSWNGVHLDRLVRSQLAHFEDLIGTRIELEGPPLFVSASAAQALGMALHELATNAGKYGALSGDEGHVTIAWSLQHPGSGEEMFHMSWREHCTIPIKAPAKFGFGFAVIGELAEFSLHARCELCFLSSGLVWEIGCSSRNVLHPSPAASVSGF
jgi:PAS domain S-box-containing protein